MSSIMLPDYHPTKVTMKSSPTNFGTPASETPNGFYLDTLSLMPGLLFWKSAQSLTAFMIHSPDRLRPWRERKILLERQLI
jgi:hypothetical protein